MSIDHMKQQHPGLCLPIRETKTSSLPTVGRFVFLEWDWLTTKSANVTGVKHMSCWMFFKSVSRGRVSVFVEGHPGCTSAARNYLNCHRCHDLSKVSPRVGGDFLLFFKCARVDQLP